MNRSRHSLFLVLSSVCMLALLTACDSVAWKRVESPPLKSRDKSFEVQVGPDMGHSGLRADRMMEFFIENLVLKPAQP